MKRLLKIAMLALLMMVQAFSYGQCAMCKAVVESDYQQGGTAAQGVNDGIIYLMIAPYILLGGVGYFIYRHYKKTKLSEDINA